MGLGIVHSLGAVYDTLHGVGKAILLPTMMECNAPCTGEKYRYIAKAMGIADVKKVDLDSACKMEKGLSINVGIPAQGYREGWELEIPVGERL